MSEVSTSPLEPAPASTAPVDIAMDIERHDPAPNSPARVLLEKQARLIDEQMRHLKLQSLNERMGAGLRLLTAVAGLAAAAALGALAWSAAHDRTAVFDAFSVPPELQARGITGEVAATRFLDHIRSIHAQSDSARPSESFANDWSQQAEVEIPGVGLSLGDLRGVLRQWLGRERHYGERSSARPKDTSSPPARTRLGPRRWPAQKRSWTRVSDARPSRSIARPSHIAAPAT